MPVSGSLARLLETRRSELNRRFELARLRHPGLEPETVLGALAGGAGELVSGLPEGRRDGALLAMFDAIVALAASGHGSAIDPLCRILASAPAHVAEDPKRVVRSVANAVVHLGAPDVAAWADSMAALGGLATSAREWLDAGLVSAWRCGLPRYRASALGRARALSTELARRALALDGEDVELEIRALQADPWWQGARSRSLRVVSRVGGFAGLGGPFVSPPTVCATGERLGATDEGGAYEIFADASGAEVVRVPHALARRGEVRAPFRYDDAGVIRLEGERLQVDRLAHASSVASTTSTLAVALPHSHFVFLVARA